MINGSEKLIDRNILVYDLILQLGIENKRYAIECNGEIIPKSEIKNRTINEGDKFEIVGAVGGG
jgi:sulfur carrier protein